MSENHYSKTSQAASLKNKKCVRLFLYGLFRRKTESTDDGTPFQQLMNKAKSGDVLVHDVFAQMRNGNITSDECRDIIEAYEKAAVPGWQRFLAGI